MEGFLPMKLDLPLQPKMASKTLSPPGEAWWWRSGNAVEGEETQNRYTMEMVVEFNMTPAVLVFQLENSILTSEVV